MLSLPLDLSNSNQTIVVFSVMVFFVFVFKSYLLKEIASAGRIIYLVLFPGVVLHEFSHLIACRILGLKVTSVKFFSRSGGFVEYSANKKSYIKNFIVSIAPVLVSGAVLYLLVKSTPIENNILNILRLIIVAYLGASVFFGLFPSYQDIKNSWVGYLILIAIPVVFRKIILSNAEINYRVFAIIALTLIIELLLIIITKLINYFRWK